MKQRKQSKMGSLLKRALTRNMFRSEIERLKRLIAFIIQYNRLKFGDATPEEYQNVVTTVERLIPTEMRQDTYRQYDLPSLPSFDYVGEIVTNVLPAAVRKSLSNTVREELNRIIEKNLYEPADLSDVSSTDSAETPPQQVPDNDEPHNKVRKTEPD